MSIPWVTWRVELPVPDVPPDDTEFVPEPKRNKKLMFIVLISAAGVTDDASVVSRPGDRLLDGSLPMANGEAVWLQMRQAEMQPDDNKGIAALEREMRGFKVKDRNSLKGAWGMWVTTSQQGDPLLVHIPLGRPHFELEGRVEARLLGSLLVVLVSRPGCQITSGSFTKRQCDAFAAAWKVQTPPRPGSRPDDPGGAGRLCLDRTHGRVLHEIVGADVAVAKASEPAQPAVQSSGMPTGEENSAVTDTEADEMGEHLRGLGYLE